jgi:hypothetical protein
MALNSGMPNQSGISTTYIYTAVAPVGTPGPASTPGSALKVFTPSQASTGQQGSATTETLVSAGITIPPVQVVGEIHAGGEADGNLLSAAPTTHGTASSGAPTPGQEPSPAPTTYVANTAAASTGQQPAVTVPFTNAPWAVKTIL